MNNVHKMVQRAFGEYPLRDATPADGDIGFIVTETDWDLGIKNDPNRCAYARALRRSLAPQLRKMGKKLAAGGIAIYKQIAYVPVSENGKIMILRYRLTSDVHARWDKGTMPRRRDMTIIAKPPTVSQQLESKRLYSQLLRKMRKQPSYVPVRRKFTPKPGASLFHVRGNLYNHHSCITDPA